MQHSTQKSNQILVDRALRYSVDAISKEAQPYLYINEKNVDIFDFSKSGISCFLPVEDVGIGISCFSDCDGVDLALGKKTSIMLKLNNTIAYQGEAKIVRREESRQGKKLAVMLSQDSLDVSKLV